MRLPFFGGGSYQSKSAVALNRRVVNFYVERLEQEGGETQQVMYPTPGFELFASPANSDGPVRATFSQNGRDFAVIGPTFYEVQPFGVLTNRGTVVQTGTGSAYITSNGDGGGELLISVDGVGYLFDLGTNTLSAITELSGTGGNSRSDFNGMLDGFFVSLDAQTSTFRISNLYNGATGQWPGAAFAQRAAAPDRWRSMLVTKPYIWLFGEQTSEAWYNAGGSVMPFAVDQSAVIPVGIAAPDSAADVGGRIFWLVQTKDGHGSVVSGGQGYPQRVSDYALEDRLSNYPTIADAIGRGFEMNGHWFYLLTFPTANASWLYHVGTSAWVEVGTWNLAAGGAYDAWAPLHHMFGHGKHLMGSRTTGAIWQADFDFTLDTNGDPVRRVIRPPSLRSENKLLFYPRAELLVQAGLGVVGSLIDAPEVELRVSNDSGETWWSAGTQHAGVQGAFETRLIWHQLGSARQRQFEWVFTDRALWYAIDAFLDVVPGTERAA